MKSVSHSLARRHAYMAKVVTYVAPVNFFNLFLFFTLLFASVIPSAFGVDKKSIGPSGFKGAELYADVQDGKIIVHLKKYYSCGFDAPETEQVSLFERETNVTRDPLILKKESSKQGGSQSILNPNSGCMSVAHYTTELNLGIARANYDITWGYCCFGSNITNLEAKDQGIALVVSLQTDGNMQNNTAASLSSLPVSVMHVNASGSAKIETTDKDNDRVSVYLSSPNSIQSMQPSPGAELKIEMPFHGTILTNKAPFKSIEYSRGFSEKRPVQAKIFSMEENTAMFSYQPTEMGNYLVAITIKETREEKIINEHQCVFIIDVQ